MRHSTARLSETPVRLAELRFPRSRVHIHRTRLAFIHLDHVLHFAKIDREGRVDGFVAAYLPDEVAMLLFRDGEVVSAVALTEVGREVIPLSTAFDRLHQELERGELVFCDAPVEQLAWMYASCASPASPRLVDPAQPRELFSVLKHERFTGVLELIVAGAVNYLRFENGAFVNGYFTDKPPDLDVSQYVECLFAPQGNAIRPVHPPVAASVFPAAQDVPPQAPPALIQTYRDLFWAIAEAAETAVPDDAMQRAGRIRDSLAGAHASLGVVGASRNDDAASVVTTPAQLTLALADWTRHFLEELEVIAPGVAPDVLRTATRSHRFILQRAGFYERLPWTVQW